jgi:N-ethylmaleimide reductase
MTDSDVTTQNLSTETHDDAVDDPNSVLFAPVDAGALQTPNRIWMAPLTRNRSNEDGTPRTLAERYYAQRATAGVIITEATQISAMGKGYAGTPGIYTDAQVEGWRRIVDAVHAAGGRIVCQLWHVGRISHVDVLPDGCQPVSSSAVQADAQVFVDGAMKDCSAPVALDEAGIAQTLADFRHAAGCALQAGFDGVEVHGANGYLLDQFLQDGVNQRTDGYGGSIDNRMRLLREVLDEVQTVWDPKRVGVRLAPLGGEAFDITDSDPRALFSAVYEMLGRRDLAYLHVVERFPGASPSQDEIALIHDLRRSYPGTYVANGGYDGEAAADAIRSGNVDAVTFGRPFLANPDLPERIRRSADWNAPDPDTFYGGGEEGYTDYPFLEETRA